MNKINYRNQMLEIINGFEGRVPTLLLHDCCAPCLSSVLEQLSPCFRITVFFYNPNILPEDEYQKRAAEVKRLLSELPQSYPARFIEGRYNVRQFLEMARGREQEPEGGERCAGCYRLRLEETAKYARAGGYDFFATTLTVSPYKDAQKLNEIGQELSGEYEVPYLPSDFKKSRGYQRSIELSREYGLYRQDFCGCPFSREAARRKRAARGGGGPD
ncbi:epoxyqueuosine reductase QueH [Caproiciproducens sp. NJN-50]|uniref:epoxyqueuosine reductase QueH n=1 Tax=Acutalibacteraceae TaxID=3082771 RepID=UPI000FFE2B1D|nr:MULTISPECIES: epoxyqueuosine reductase QueH [Acutalibacteraceae]QAT51021.1 epoxyqueuosine reductase QueH [Caproiciproducens sp. NJN-50]